MLTLTKTMLNKSIIDANKTVREFAATLGINYAEMKPGQKTEIPGLWPDGSKTVIRFYLTAGKRADRRISVKDIKKHAVIGDTLVFTAVRRVIHIEVQS